MSTNGHETPGSPETNLEKIPELAEICQILGDEVRLKVLLLLKEKNPTVTDLTSQMNITQASMSHHLNVLMQKNMVMYTKGPGHFHTYKLTNDYKDALSKIDFTQIAEVLRHL